MSVRLGYLPVLLTLLCAGACRSPATLATPADEPSAAPSGADPSSAEQPQPSAEPSAPAATTDPQRPYAFVWSAALGDWNHSVSFTTAGDPVVINERKLYLLDRHDGSVLESSSLPCRVSGDLLFIDAHTGVVPCDVALMEVGLPGLTVRRVYEVAKQSRNDEMFGTDVQVKGFAYGTRGGKFVVLRRVGSSYEVLLRGAGTGEIESLALAPELDRLAVGFEGPHPDGVSFIQIYELPSGTPRARIEISDRQRITAMSFSPDGKLVFAHAGSFEAGIIDADTGTWYRNYEVGSWVSTSVWIRPNLVAGAGSDGTTLFPVDGGSTVVLEIPGVAYPTAEGVGGALDGSMFCSGTRKGDISCWANQPLTPSTYTPGQSLVAQ